MEKSYLIDTNIILQIMLGREKAEVCKDFLVSISQVGLLALSDFSLHSLGVILTKKKRLDVLSQFMRTDLESFRIVSLSHSTQLTWLVSQIESLGLDFDDAYQFHSALKINASIVTLDKDFEKVKDKVEVIFL